MDRAFGPWFCVGHVSWYDAPDCDEMGLWPSVAPFENPPLTPRHAASHRGGTSAGGREPRTDHLAGASYLELVEFITRQGAQPVMDLEELWRRIVLSIAVHNTDDHLRNHGFLLNLEGWCISPVYDLNPDPDGVGLSLNISQSDNALSFDLALEVVPYFRLTPRPAESILRQVRDAVRGWKKHVRRLGITEAEQETMTKAFEE